MLKNMSQLFHNLDKLISSFRDSEKPEERLIYLCSIKGLIEMGEEIDRINPNEETNLEDLPEKIRFFDRKNFAKYPLCAVSSLKEAVMEFESNLIKEAIGKYGNVRKTADFLKVDRTTITRKMRKYNLGKMRG